MNEREVLDGESTRTGTLKRTVHRRGQPRGCRTSGRRVARRGTEHITGVTIGDRSRDQREHITRTCADPGSFREEAQRGGRTGCQDVPRDGEHLPPPFSRSSCGEQRTRAAPSFNDDGDLCESCHDAVARTDHARVRDDLRQ
jgi:hypothetical protein